MSELDVVFLSAAIMSVAFAFIIGKYFGIIQERKRSLRESVLQYQEEIEYLYEDNSYSPQYINENDKIISVYFSKEDLINDISSNKIIYSFDKNKYIKTKSDE